MVKAYKIWISIVKNLVRFAGLGLIIVMNVAQGAVVYVGGVMSHIFAPVSVKDLIYAYAYRSELTSNNCQCRRMFRTSCISSIIDQDMYWYWFQITWSGCFLDLSVTLAR